MNIKTIRNKLPLLTFLGALATLAAGILIVILSDDIVEKLLVAAVVLLLYLYGAQRFLQSAADGHLQEGGIAMAVMWSAGTVLFYLGAGTGVIKVLPDIIVGAVALLMGIVRLLICVNCVINGVPGRFRNGLSAAMCIVFGLFLLIRPIENFRILSLVAGFYLIFYAVTMFSDAFAAVLGTDLRENRFIRRIHFAMPNILSATKPTRMIAKFNRDIADGKLTHGMLTEVKAQTQFDRVNIEILVHLTTQGANKFGHVDIAIGDTVYTYGSYDESRVKFGGFVAQGTIVTVPKLPYLKYCLDHQKKYVIGFGAYLSESQLGTVMKRFENILKETEPLKTAYESAVEGGGDGEACTDSASNLVRMGGRAYTVTSGMFRRYFGINTNCVRFADWLLSDSGIDAISFSGLRTPGAYYTMLENMFRRKNTRVIRKTSYLISKDIRLTDKLSGE